MCHGHGERPQPPGPWAHSTFLATPYPQPKPHLQPQPLPGHSWGNRASVLTRPGPMCPGQVSAYRRIRNSSSQGAQPAGTVTLPPASYHSMGSASPALPSALLALAKTGSLFPQRLNKASQSHSLSLCLCGLLVQGSRKS
ncbi:hypothetical protein H8959_018906 [Pygathrix nigripes]